MEYSRDETHRFSPCFLLQEARRAASLRWRSRDFASACGFIDAQIIATPLNLSSVFHLGSQHLIFFLQPARAEGCVASSCLCGYQYCRSRAVYAQAFCVRDSEM